MTTSSRAVVLGAGVTLSARVSTPSAAGGRVRIQVDYLDPLGDWVFNRLFVTRANATLVWTPPKLGRWRVKAIFLGTRAASPSESRYAVVDVR